MRFCEFEKCELPVFGTDKNTRKGYCKKHQSQRTDYDRRSILQKAVSKKQKGLEGKIRGLINTDANTEMALRKFDEDLKEWFAYHMEHAPKRCNNCGASIAHYNMKYLHGSQHHIIEKHLCPSVATDLRNHVVLGFFCCHSQAHTSYANVVKMPVFRLMKERFELFKDCIAEEERYKVPECFLTPVKQVVSG